MKQSVTGRKILFVEDDAALRKTQAEYFARLGNSVREAGTLREAEELLGAEPFDAVILDLILPDGKGIELFEKFNMPPVIVQTTLNDEDSVLDGFSAGAADYAVKPCSAKVLEARLSLRLLPKAEAIVSLHGITLDANERTAFCGTTNMPLTGSEFNILYFFMTHAGRFFTADEIYENVWQMPSLKSTSVKYHISNLRRKLITTTGKTLIFTEFGKGYAFAGGNETIQ
jgi:DNA-binding response OmpR family regulator